MLSSQLPDPSEVPLLVLPVVQVMPSRLPLASCFLCFELVLSAAVFLLLG